MHTAFHRAHDAGRPDLLEHFKGEALILKREQMIGFELLTALPIRNSTNRAE